MNHPSKQVFVCIQYSASILHTLFQIIITNVIQNEIYKEIELHSKQFNVHHNLRFASVKTWSQCNQNANLNLELPYRIIQFKWLVPHSFPFKLKFVFSNIFRWLTRNFSYPVVSHFILVFFCFILFESIVCARRDRSRAIRSEMSISSW